MNNTKAIIRSLPIIAKSFRRQKSSVKDFGLLVIATREDRIVIQMDDIQYIKSDSNYTIIQTTTQKHIFAKTLKAISEKLDNRFYRLHQSYIINVTKIQRYNYQDQSVELSDGVSIPISRAKKKEFLEFLN
ncbi:MAG: two-component system LytT family response regulator [Saprospiraceae bacterium]|jgi:two-component system LytT family response regulator